MNVGFVSLGCSKNLVDTEMMIGLFKSHQYTIVNNPKEADIIIINTCGFIESAKEEAINTILEMAEYKKKRCKYVIAMGCLVQRYKKELEKAIPEVDLFLSIDEYEEAWAKIEKALGNELESSKGEHMHYLDRQISTGKTIAYLKIAEGCSNKCTYCAIPSIRGPFVSRKMEDIILEAKQLAEDGIKEIIVIAQDTTKYGIDIYGKPKLAELLQKLCEIKGIEWIRFLYAYPETITEELIQTVRDNDKICNYFDIPIQHIADRVLKRMNRQSDGNSIRNTIDKIRKEIPEVIIRTTLIVGFPGETKEEFKQLYDFVKETKFDRLGVFMYSKEEGTPAARLKEQIHPMTKKSRYRQTMELQQEIVSNIEKEQIGKKYKALVESVSFDGNYYIARTYREVPDMDGVVYLKNTGKLEIGEFVTCQIIENNTYDLIGEIVWEI